MGFTVQPHPVLLGGPRAPKFFLRPRWKGMFLGQVEVTKSGTILRTWRTDPGLIAMNAITNAGIEDNESVYFNSGTQKTLWYIGHINNSPTPTLADGDTIASHSGWVEATTYSEATRQQWVPGSPSSKTITNPVSVSFSINGTIGIYGAFLVSNNTKNGTSGMMWSTGPFNTVQNLTTGQTLRLSYTLAGAHS